MLIFGDWELEYFINRINKLVCQPYECPELDYKNEKEVTHYSFHGDGSGDNERFSSEAKRPVVESYIKHCQQQLLWAEEYLIKLGLYDNQE